MEAGLHFIGYLLTFFLAFLYFPNLLFKYSAEYAVDLGRRRDSGELEEFFSAVIPCIILNAFTWTLLLVGTRLGCPWRPHADWDAVARLVGNEHGGSHFLAVAESRETLFWYATLLLFVAVVNGLIYGRAVRRVTSTRHIAERRPQRPLHPSVTATSWWVVRVCAWLVIETACLIVYRVWHPVYHEEIIELYRYAVQRPWVFVRMQGDRLYYGRFDRYDKAADGNIESVTLSDVRRYCYDEVDKCLADGRLPVSRFQGPLRIAISQVTDIHTVPENHFRSIEYRYAQMMIRMLGRDLLTAFSGQRHVTVREIYMRHAGGTNLTRFRYRQALRYLEDFGFVTIHPTTIGASPQSAPDDGSTVVFPTRVASRFDDFFGGPTPREPLSPQL